MTKCFLCCAFFVLMLSYCDSSKRSSPNKFADTIIVKIADFQDRRISDSVIQYLRHEDVIYRREAALALASIQDSTTIKSLGALIDDPDSTVRKAVVFALGQTPSRLSENLLLEICGVEKNKFVLQDAIEAYGKVSTSWKLALPFEDSILTAALAWSYYRVAVRGIADSSMNVKAAEFLKPLYSLSTRMGAAHYFARGAKNFESFSNQLIALALSDPSPDVRMAAVLALRKVSSDSVLTTCIAICMRDKDARVRVNAIRSLQSFPFQKTKASLVKALQDSSINVSIAASEVIKESISKESWTEIQSVARTTKNWRVQANLYEASLAVSDHKELAEEIQSVYNASTNSYQKAALITALKHSLLSFRFVEKQLLESTIPVIKLAAASSLTAMNYHKNFGSSLRPVFAEIYKAALAEGDVALTTIITEALADSSLQYKSTIKDFSFLYNAKKKLSLPKDLEGLVALENAIAYFEGKKIKRSPINNSFNHPIPWKLVKQIPHDQKAIIKTTKGEIVIRLLVEEAPGSVANFVLLSLSNYYRDKFIHRVVPNFVVQAGCNRGDGWGSEDYSIRSEFFYRRYQTGAVGMASAGKDTEGTQWFITHSPTPHLEGRYSLFAMVERGMDVVNVLEVGDKILSVDIINFKPI